MGGGENSGSSIQVYRTHINCRSCKLFDFNKWFSLINKVIKTVVMVQAIQILKTQGF